MKYKRAAQLADGLQRDYHYTVDEKQKSILLTEEGYEVSEDILQVGSKLEITLKSKVTYFFKSMGKILVKIYVRRMGQKVCRSD